MRAAERRERAAHVAATLKGELSPRLYREAARRVLERYSTVGFFTALPPEVGDAYIRPHRIFNDEERNYSTADKEVRCLLWLLVAEIYEDGLLSGKEYL
jgi:hypothetical protein